MQSTEIWKPIKGYEGLYEVSSLGRIRTLGRTIQTWLPINGERRQVNRTYPAKILKLHPVTSEHPYLQCTLYKSGQSQTFLVHRLVAETFISNPENKPEVNHKDRNKRNNCVDNLEWMTRIENILDGIQKGVDPGKGRRGKKNSAYHNQRLSEVHRGKIYSEKQIRKLQTSHVTQAIKLRCNETGQEFISIAEASRIIGVDPATIRDSMKYGWKVHHKFTFIEIG